MPHDRLSRVHWSVLTRNLQVCPRASPALCALVEQSYTLRVEIRIYVELYRSLKERIQSLGNNTTRLTIPEGITPTTMKNRVIRVAAELGISVTVRKVPGGLLFWRSTDEDVQQAKEVADRLQTARREGRPRPGRRRRA